MEPVKILHIRTMDLIMKDVDLMEETVAYQQMKIIMNYVVVFQLPIVIVKILKRVRMEYHLMGMVVVQMEKIVTVQIVQIHLIVNIQDVERCTKVM